MDLSTPSTFRFEFSPEFATILYQFAQLHRFDNRHIFKEAWEEWRKLHENEIADEITLLKSNGYNGSVLDKMYKSARYYFRKKTPGKVEPKERRKYVSIDTNVIEVMDSHIMDWCRRADFKPATAFSDFCVSQKSLLEKEVSRLYNEENLNSHEIPSKLKKTYKNRYFQKVKGPSLASTA